MMIMLVVFTNSTHVIAGRLWLKRFCEYEDQGDSVRQIANILHVVECMVMMVRSELQFSPTYFLKFHIEVSVQIGLVE
ncbi:hypothetical protein T12_10574 [Trichinella patagoniensis]|uniref:Uncharacterized protein n=1 Tax=Trichinella patagoniensis TaxID=990121 RepID=A0A0V1A9J2_9BILA|nr:hypothetical protein T12_10574 [Trichinella patagoniensis]